MKILRFAFVFFILAASVVGCKYDDEELWNRVNSLEERIESLESQLTSMNKDISSISTVVNALQNNLSVTSIEETENGYTLTFSDDQKITIKNGTDGEDGNDAPIIGVDLFEGKYYWTQTIDGTKTWLTDAKGNKFPVAGESGVTPRLKVSATGHWMVSYDNGISYTEVLDEKGKPVQAVGKDGEDGEDGKDGHNGSSGSDGKDGDSFFKDVKVDGDELVLVLKDGMEIRLPYTGSGEIGTPEDAINVKGSVDLEDVEGLTLESVIDEQELGKDKAFSVDVLSNDISQLLIVTDKDGNVIMMSRGFYASGTDNKIDAQSTAFALVATYPLFAPFRSEDFKQLQEITTKSSHFSKLCTEVEKSIEARKDIFDTTNTTLIEALTEVIDDVCASAEKMATKAQVQASSLRADELMDEVDFGNTFSLRIKPSLGNLGNLEIKNTHLAPPYEYQVQQRGNNAFDWSEKSIETGIIPSRTSYGILDIFGIASEEFQMSDPVNIILAGDGDYRFHFNRCTKNAAWELIKLCTNDLLSIVGLSTNLIEDLNLQIFEQLALDWANIAASISSENMSVKDLENLITSSISSIINILRQNSNDMIKALQAAKKDPNANIIDLDLRIVKHQIQLEKFDDIGKWMNIYSIGTGVINCSARLAWYFDCYSFSKDKAQKQISFYISNAKGEIRYCCASSMEEAGGNYQKGYVNKQLTEPLRVQVKSFSDATFNPSHIPHPVQTVYYHKVKFEVVSGNGSLSTSTPIEVNEEGYAETYWTLGNETSTEQIVKATLIDATRNVEISEPIIFMATAEENNDDRQALIDLYNATGGDNWTNNTNWCSDKPLDEWYGVTTNEEGRVIRLELDDNGAYGLGGNNIIGSADFSKLTELQYISCSDSKLTAINVSGLTKLETLYCGNNELTTLDVSGLINLRFLEFADNKISNIEISGLNDLEYIRCDYNQLTSLVLSDLPNLKILVCPFNPLTTLDVSKLTNLELLRCEDLLLSQIDVSNLTQLKSFECQNNNITNLDISNLKNLEYFMCHNNQLNSLDVSGLTKLATLHCNNNSIQDLNLSGAVGLQSLSCSNNQLANLELPQAINLTYLECSNNQLTTLNISGLSNLNSIFANGNDLLTVYLSSFPEHFSYEHGGVQDREQYPSPNHIDGYQYPEFIYQ